MAAIRLLLPDPQNLQLVLFFMARAARFFDDGGLAIELSSPDAPNGARAMFDKTKPDAMLLPAPMLASMVAERAEIVVCANVLANDPINLVCSAKVAAERGLSAKRPLRERLSALKGLRLGIAPHPPPRLRALFASVGLSADEVVSVVTLRGPDQNHAFTNGEVDLLYAHTPFLEHAIVRDHGVLLVDQSSGEVPELSHRQFHALAFRRESLVSRRGDAVAMVRALAKAGQLLRVKNEEAGATLARSLPTRSDEEVRLIAKIYAPALPQDLTPSAEEITKSLLFYPEHMPKPDFTGRDLGPFVDTSIAKDAQDTLRDTPGATAASSDHALALGVGGAAVLTVAALLALRTRRTGKPRAQKKGA